MNKRLHVHADLIHAWAEGAEIQWQEEDGTWHDLENPTWGASCVYRINPRTVKREGLVNVLEAAKAAIEECLKCESIRSEAGFDAGVQLERERIRDRAKIAAEKTWKAGDLYIGPQHNMIEKFVNALLEDGDE